MSSVLSLPGTAGNYLSTPSTVQLNLSGTDFSIEIDFVPDSTLDGGDILVGKDSVAGNGRSWGLTLQALTHSNFWVFNDAGAGAHAYNGGAGSLLTLADGVRVRFRIDVDINTGAGSSVKWYEDEVLKETQTWATTLDGGGQPINPDGTDEVRIGARGDDDKWMPMDNYRVRIWTDLTQTTLVLDSNPQLEAPGTTSFTESSPNAATMTVNQSGSPQAEIIADQSTVILRRRMEGM